jgi:hypothetical protein
MTKPPAPDDQPPGNGHLRYDSGAGHPGGNPLEAQRAGLASFWALVLRRFRTYAQRGSSVTDRYRQREGR